MEDSCFYIGPPDERRFKELLNLLGMDYILNTEIIQGELKVYRFYNEAEADAFLSFWED